ncbi:MAG: DegT/DnrJ/EryC1/StrS aminotransferase family protein [Candidatus Scalindua sp.]|jgi:CDP-6-deoxy-D-xylo-4-hexulose-3-dehydrase|nr:DegT/DnrJ/EryC1/StrS aminotransferase family protein [Candidatus Scalindua sp.]MBT5307337.1 DegT/DnrJ/EryC1/StrS aminotransferase family protein [Candidatus Scalindua sp.]MBT6230174.1 DegT/DnrJ/EryC1/StrS aminotransferase family protein [Candidatus Scalindua sp.]MBT6563185.1 DegT/DnrJ/EryC1/StrS aminotransferase family protein [Candidatus Scalindua sp.]MBT7212483.1 DegT/DnrJ/EryC1/StrS aminotransferase family protein [Candidatus Scalindua sp.]
MKLNWQLMKNNITREDLDVLIDYLKQDEPFLTQSTQVREFEREWAEWVGVKYCVYVNSGASANLLTITALKYLYGEGEIVLPPLTWVSDIASVIQNDLKPVFVDINPKTLCMDDARIISALSDRTRAVFITHVQGFNGLTDRLINVLEDRNIPLIEDVCESHGATFKGRKLGSFGLISNFSFYYAHHMSTIEGGMVCTDDKKVYEMIRMLRSHGMVREGENDATKQEFIDRYPDLSPDFIFAYPAYNVRNTEIGAVLGRNQLKRLDANNEIRKNNFKLFLTNLDSAKYRIDFALEGSCNYAFNLVIKTPDPDFRDKVEQLLTKAGVEFRRGSSGGGNQLRQPYLRGIMPEKEYEKYPEVEHIHFYGYYIGNYPDLEDEKILLLCDMLNRIEVN